MEQDEKILVIESDSKIIRPKFKPFNSYKNINFQKKIFEKDLYTLNRHQIKNNEELLFTDDDKDDIKDLLEQMNYKSSVQLNLEENSLEKSKISNQTSPEVMELLNLLSQPLDSCPKKRFITSKNNRYAFKMFKNSDFYEKKNNEKEKNIGVDKDNLNYNKGKKNINKNINENCGLGVTDSTYSNTRQQQQQTNINININTCYSKSSKEIPFLRKCNSEPLLTFSQC